VAEKELAPLGLEHEEAVTEEWLAPDLVFARENW
jgi:hypothetical protein